MSELLKYLFDICCINASPDDTSPDAALHLIKQALGPIKEKMVDEAVEGAIAAGKLRQDERDWATDFADGSLVAFRIFLEKRGPVRTSLLIRTDPAAGAGGRMTEIERKIARQMGVSDATFAKYNGRQNGTGDAGRSISQLQAETNRKLGVKPDVFAKYNGEAGG
jgi:hypothetical protein